MDRLRSTAGALSSRDPTSKPIAVRLPADLVAAIEHACREHNITASELLRGLVSQWVYGKTALSGPEEGYTEARSMATRLAHAALKEALEKLPLDHGRATEMLNGYYEREREERKG
jgi:hypothetical protein